jgi:hypothetical protein
MCCPVTTGKIITFFKAVEWIFVLCVGWMMLSVIFPRYFFNGCIKTLNWLIKSQGFDGVISGNEKAFKQFRRDILILLVLETLVIVLIELL